MKVKKYDEGKEAECPDDTPHSEIEKSVGDRNYYNNEENDQKKEDECLYDTSPEDMEEDLSDKKMTRAKIMMRKKD